MATTTSSTAPSEASSSSAAPTQDYSKLKIPELKALCKDRGLKVGGKKADLINRLATGQNEVVAKKPRARTHMYVRNGPAGMSEKAKQVNEQLKTLGVTNVDGVSKCLRAGILHGIVKLTGDKPLDKVICNGECESCNAKMSATIRDIMYQADYGGDG